MKDSSSPWPTPCEMEADCEFVNDRRVVLLHAGYEAKGVVWVGYYESILGLSRKGTGGEQAKLETIQVRAGACSEPGSLNAFWRSVENVQVGSMNWYVSQASPFRNIRVTGDTNLFYYDKDAHKGCFASGGFGANSVLQGDLLQGGNQQWLLVNSSIGGSWQTDMWNSVGVDVKAAGGMKQQNAGVPFNACSNFLMSTQDYLNNGVPRVPTCPKPFLAFDETAGGYGLVVPNLLKAPAPAGPVDLTDAPWQKLDDAAVLVVLLQRFDPGACQKVLDRGGSLVFTPDVYPLAAPLTVTKSTSVIMGLGQATLQGNPAIVVAVAGARVCSLLLESLPVPNPQDKDCVLLLKQPDGVPASLANRTVVQDVWVRHGTKSKDYSSKLPSLQALVVVDQSYAFLESVWLWRADHLSDASAGIGNDVAPARHNLWVKPDASNVCALGLQTEHSLEECTFWEGNDGTVVFLQAETNYDRALGDQTSGMLVTGSGFVGVGLGVYMYAPRCPGCTIPCGVKSTQKATLKHLGSVWLNGPEGATSSIDNVGCVAGSQSGIPSNIQTKGHIKNAFCT